MTGIKHAVVLAVGLAVASAGMATAGQQRPYRVSDQQLKDLVNRIDTHRDAFHDSFERAIDRSPIKGSPTADQAYRSMKDFDQAADLLRNRVNDRQSGTPDAENLLRRASDIDSLMTRLSFETTAQRDWQALRLDMNDLTRAYGIAGNWSAASQNMPARVDDNQVKQLLKTIGQKADTFDKGLDRAFTNGQPDAGRGKDEVRRSVQDLKQATNRLRDRVNGRQSNTLDAEEVLRRGASIDGFMQRYRLSAQTEQDGAGAIRDTRRRRRVTGIPSPAPTSSRPAGATIRGGRRNRPPVQRLLTSGSARIRACWSGWSRPRRWRSSASATASPWRPRTDRR
jgi:hypothetical protein